ncbi:probable JmjC domain-containing histone demethylation protein 2C isoform X2 [Uloborus diversus]|uniref:probable JmjC domain-containing histone demethylation protein 2C isoform X2 n=1 Tax=Uloborus diversus TaxID=327109 RepID=UPI002408F3F2|nr:probable JmjC domain-containing histone demethylation protein 2C isoform X2 [Uloborus diversus]
MSTLLLEVFVCKFSMDFLFPAMFREERLERHERAERHERIERQKEERSEKERQLDWQDQERLEKEERERAQEAVQQHFEESLRLALQKQQKRDNVGWTPVATNKGIVSKGRENSPTISVHSAQRLADVERMRDQEKERSQMDSHVRHEHERWLAIVQQQRNEQNSNSSQIQGYSPVEPRSLRNVSKQDSPQMASHGPSSKQNLTPSPISSSAPQMKEKFSLYGYQPFQHTYITHAQLKAREESQTSSSQSVRVPSSNQPKSTLPPKGEKDPLPERSYSPGSSHERAIANQIPPKHQMKVMLPVHERGNSMYQPVVGGGGAFKPYEFAVNSSSPIPPAHQSTSSTAVGRITSQYQQLQEQPQNLVKADCKSNEKTDSNYKYETRENKPTGNPATASLPPPYSQLGISKSTSPGITYSYSLIQQGLVPNPMYIASAHSGNASNPNTPPVSYALPQAPSKNPMNSGSPPLSQQYGHLITNSNAGTSVCRPSSAPYAMPANRVNRSYSPVAHTVPHSVNMNSNKMHMMPEAHLSSRVHFNVQGSSHRSPSPAHLHIPQSNSGALSPRQSSPHLTGLPSHAASQLSNTNMASSPYICSSPSENQEIGSVISGIPLVKRKLVTDVVPRKRPKSIDDTLMPPQLLPQVQNSSIEDNENAIVTPPHLISNAPMLSEHQAMDSLGYAKSNPPSPMISSNLIYKSDAISTPPLMPDIIGASVSSHSDSINESDYSGKSQNYTGGLGKFKISNKNGVLAFFNESIENTNKCSSGSSEICSVSTANTSEAKEDQIAGTSVVINSNSSISSSNTSSSNHPKLKKAWLQRHSENEDKKVLPEQSIEIKTESAVKSEFKNDVKSEAKRDIKAETKRESKTEAKREIKSEAKREIKSEAKREMKSEAKREVKSEVKREVKFECKRETKPESKRDIKSEAKREVKSEAKREIKSETKRESKSENKLEIKPECDIKPEIKVETKLELKVETEEEDVPEITFEMKPENKVEIRRTQITIEYQPDNKVEPDLDMEVEDAKSENSINEGLICEESLDDSKIGSSEDGNLEICEDFADVERIHEFSSCESEIDFDLIMNKKKNKSRKSSPSGSSINKKLKTSNNSDAVDDQPSPKKENKKKNNSFDKDLCSNPTSSSTSRKRGRKKGKNSSDENSKKKESKSSVATKTTEKPSVAYLKKTGEPFLQDGPCCDVAPRLPKCRECRMTPHQRSKKMPNIFCRFYAYRKLRYGKNGTILSAGFSEPSDASEEDLKLWLPPIDSPSADIEIETSKFLLTHMGDKFCDLVEMEREAQKLHLSTDVTITWKRVVQGVREMCDVCETTLFNIHWVCHKCGFVVCIDCYKFKKNGVRKDQLSRKDRDEFNWLFCSNRQVHDQEKLMLTQIIAGSALWDVGKSLHEIRQKWNIPSYCNCGLNDCDQDSKNPTNGICKLMSAVTKCFSSDKDSSRDGNGSSESSRSAKRSGKASMNGIVKQEDGLGGYSSESGGSPLSWLADVALNSSSKIKDDQKDKDDDERLSEDLDSNADASNESDDDDDKSENFSTLRELLIRPTGKMGGKGGSGSSSQKTLTSTLDEVISCVIEQKVRKSDKKCKEKQLLHFTRRYQMSRSGRELPPIRTCILAESSLLYPEIPHLWLGNGKILLLKEPYHSGNMQLFQEQWKRGQPVIVADVSRNLDPSIWTPESFLEEFGDYKCDFINCACGTLLPNQPMRKFWEGFENTNKRMKGEDGAALTLKLVDWPPNDEFSELLPSRYDNLMKALPLPQYTHRDGIFNMASRLPDCFVQPDLGPKMYNSYGLSSSLGKGSTNLHLDVSDAVNVLAYVSCAPDVKDELPEYMKALEDSGCDNLMKLRVKEKGSKPGAIWHVFNARDADKIRDFLNKVSEERGVKLNPHHDPLHNQGWYLDEKLRARLYKEYGVEPYTIAQCYGDALFIPAGSPHQIQDLYSCVKVSEDFVSPESIGHSFFLTQEIRNLTDGPVNQEDKLQVKNIIYHGVKDALALLQSHDPEDSKP